jgi:amino acid adenylation domain-containing protein
MNLYAKTADETVAAVNASPLGEDELQRLLIDWNRTEAEYPCGMQVQQLFEAQASKTPEAVAVVFARQSLCYRELNARANRLARYLRRCGVVPETLIGIFVERSLEMVVGLLGILKAGGAYVPLDPSYPTERLAIILEDTQAPILLTQQRLRKHVPRFEGVLLSLDGQDADLNVESGENLTPVGDSDNLAYVIFTSGSTGRPKGVQITHRAFVNFLWSMRERPGLQANDVLLAVTTLCFDIAGLEIFLPLLVGATTVIADRETTADPRLLMKALAETKATVMQATPATWQMLLDAGWPGDKRLKALCGGEAMPPTLADALQERCAELWNMYGPTETTVWSTLYRVLEKHESIPIGRPIANTKIYILDANLQPVPFGEEGELYIGGHGVSRGYLHRPDLTTERFLPNPFTGIPGDRIYRTGDLARYLPDGNLVCLGRIDHQVKIRGFRIELGEIEATMMKHPNVRQAVVVAREEQAGDKRLVCYVVAKQKPAPEATALHAYVRALLPEYMVPSAYVVLDALPLTPNGKIDRRALPAPSVFGAEPRKDYVAPRDGLETKLVQIWEELLNTKPIGVRDDFFEAGVHSLLAVRLLLRVEKEFDKSLSLGEFLQASTVEQLASLLRGNTKTRDWKALVPIQTSGLGSPLYLVHAGTGNIPGYYRLARYLGPDVSVYGLQAVAMDGITPAHTRVEEMAAYYIREIRQCQPEGPYYLGGYCFGGTLAYEMARQLYAIGQEVAFLALLNAGTPAYNMAQYRWGGMNEAEEETAEIQQPRQQPKPSRSAFRHIAHQLRWKVQPRINRMRDRVLVAFYRALRRPLPFALRGRYVLRANNRAERAYKPPPYGGKITLFVSEGYFPNPTLGWEGLAEGGIEIVNIPGPHKTYRDILHEPGILRLAERIREKLAEVQSNT